MNADMWFVKFAARYSYCVLEKGLQDSRTAEDMEDEIYRMEFRLANRVGNIRARKLISVINKEIERS